MKDWQRGYAIEDLKAAAAPFKRMKRFAHGQFSVPNEARVAEALDDKRFARTPSLGAALIYKSLSRPRVVRDFRGGKSEIPAGGVHIEAIGWNEETSCMEDAGALARNLEATHGAVYLSVNPEDPQMVALAEGQLHLQPKVRVVRASSELCQVWGPAAWDPATSYTPDELATLEPVSKKFLRLDDLLLLIQRELRPYLETLGEWTQHYSNYNWRESWTGISLRGYSTDPAMIEKPAEMNREWKSRHPDELEAGLTWTKAAKDLPALCALSERIAKWANSTGQPHLERARLMRLRAKGKLTRHADIVNRNAGVANGCYARLHLPLAVTNECTFESWDSDGSLVSYHPQKGDLFYLDQRKPHQVTNAAETDRIHLVCDVLSGPALRRALGNFAS